MFVRARLAIVVALLFSACAEPPNREMDQAQGAIDAARAAGADQYATEEFTAAVTALKQSQDAVALGDYRSALNYALDSRERAQNAAKQASDQRAAVRSQVERALTQINALLDRGEQRVATAESRRVPRKTITRVTSALADARTVVQKASAAAERGEYPSAQRDLEGVQDRVTAAVEELEGLLTPRQGRGRR